MCRQLLSTEQPFLHPSISPAFGKPNSRLKITILPVNAVQSWLTLTFSPALLYRPFLPLSFPLLLLPHSPIANPLFIRPTPNSCRRMKLEQQMQGTMEFLASLVEHTTTTTASTSNSCTGHSLSCNS
jgi:hypothetical protein